MKLLVGPLLALFSFVLSFGVAEGIARYASIEWIDGEKKILLIDTDLVNCYSSDTEARLPIDLRDSETEYLEFFGESLFENLQRDTPHCIIYDRSLREGGPFPERKDWIAIIGDSFAFGEGLTHDRTLASYLASLDPQRNYRTFAQSGASIDWMHYLATNSIRQESKPEQALYIFNLNDILISKEIAADRDRIHQHIMDDTQSREVLTQNGGELSDSFIAILSLLKRIRIQRDLNQKRIQNYYDMYFSEDNREHAKETLETLKTLNSMYEREGIPFTVIIYPILYKDLFGRYPFKMIHIYLMNYCRSHGIHCVDGLPAFDEDYFMSRLIVHPVDYHPNERANEKMARLISTKLSLHN